MIRNTLFIIAICLAASLSPRAQGTTNRAFTLQQCIDYALEHNLSVKQSSLNAEISKVTTNQLRMSRFPSVDASARQNLAWSDVQSSTDGSWAYEGSVTQSLGINASLNIFNGLRTYRSIQQGEIDYQAGLLDTETQRDNLKLQVLGAYTQVLYAIQQVDNAMRQVNVTKEQLNQASERLQIGSIAKADYLQVATQLAQEQLTLTNARNLLATNRITLMQLMEYPIAETFEVVQPDMSQLTVPAQIPLASEVYRLAQQQKPQVESAKLKTQSALIAVDLAKATALPSLALDAGLSTNYTDKVQQLTFGSQLEHNLTPSLGLTLSIPLFTQGKTKSQVSQAQIRGELTKLDGQNTLNQLRKNIENACLDVSASSAEYQSASQQYQSAQASFEQAKERFAKGVISTIDFLVQKTNLINAESAVLQSRYNLIFSLKTLDFYSGNPLSY
jgi:outer membrane protein